MPAGTQYPGYLTVQYYISPGNFIFLLGTLEYNERLLSHIWNSQNLGSPAYRVATGLWTVSVEDATFMHFIFQEANDLR